MSHMEEHVRVCGKHNSPAIVATGILVNRMASKELARRENARKMLADLDGFLNNSLGWYNEIIKFSTVLAHKAIKGTLDEVKKDHDT